MRYLFMVVLMVTGWASAAVPEAFNPWTAVFMNDERWKVFAESSEENGTVFLLDEKTVKRGVYPEAWVMQKIGCDGYASECILKNKIKYKFDCSGSKFVTLRVVEYSKNQKALSDRNYSDRSIIFSEAIPNSIGEALIEHACKNYYKRSKKGKI